MNEKILVVEDDDDIRENLIELLNLLGYEALEAANGTEGISLAVKNNPDLILCDILMPECDGYDVYKKLQEVDATRDIPFIFLTAKAELKDIRTGMGLGADDYIVKPFSSKDLKNSINIRLKKARRIKPVESEQTNIEKAKILDYEETALLMSGGKPHLVAVKEIKHIQADSQYSTVFFSKKGQISVRKSIKDWEAILPEKHFLRVHRSTIINLNHVEKIEKWFNNSFVVKIKEFEDTLPISQRYASKLRKKLL
ncbi:MAG: response regulator [Bacteroidetes bacterium]|nr:response regulator [Bacteroidota bacterium]